MPSLQVLIVGAGPTGMTLALELKRMGITVRLIDKKTHLAEHSQALVIQARTLEQFQRYGIAEETVRSGRKLTSVRGWSEGKPIVSLTIDQIAGRYPYLLFLPQNETEAILNRRMEAAGVWSERGLELMRFEQMDGQVHSTLRHSDGREEQVISRWLVGCDGARSTVRKQSGIDFSGSSVDMHFFLGDLELQGPDAPGNEINIRLNKGNVLFMAPLSAKYTRLIVALQGDRQAEERRDRVLALADFQQAIDQAGARIQVLSADWMTPFRINDRQAERYRVGNVLLAGDASHIHSPVGGQGMNTGIQDAANLAWKLAAVARGAADELLDSYYEERGAVGKALLRSTERVLKVVTATNPLLRGIRDTVAPLVSKQRWIQRAVAGFVSETAINYRSSSIVSDQGGDGSLRAGDRMPDLALDDTNGRSSLLTDWTDGGHLALLYRGTEAEALQVRNRFKQVRLLVLQPDQLDIAGKLLLGLEEKLLLLRPDGYVGYRGPLAASALNDYAIQNALNV